MARRVTAWVGWIWFAGLMILTSGVLNVLYGFAAVLGPDNAVVDAGASLVVLDVQGWGWTHLILGVLLVLVGICVMAGQTWARVGAIVLVTLNLIAQFVWLPVQPWWSIIVIAIDLLVLWALVVHGHEAREA
ncbi:conserved hypothetical protein [Beutenbergia cavernae DSM 12333]|uniref:DUF7144 domain-containing protein n=1 Tax=Beutenbergia cavernae (strain ATCC BAA-8 / DSM 12333 / CCUG 43141 / JCM 11478 / NBRC 16432 / NCIMB 13614 / HKI 0122) TaxID=471853 RepID=C5BYQ6_BEUC1|nr:hypothetical protein [Beutenbergia cavernae]ACQ79014.1 conserved hypothetical protein [Beutenbergia cavernae DSM 12333]